MNQHLVSRVLLRRWSNYDKGPICELDLNELTQRVGAVESFGAIRDLITEDAEKTEKLWGRVERKLEHPFKLLDQGLILETTNQKYLDTLKDCLALHFARSSALLPIMKGLQPQFVDQATQGVLRQYTPTQALKAMTGLYIPGGEAYTIFRQKVDDQFTVELHRRILAETFEKTFNTAREKVGSMSLEISVARTSEFIIGDCPVITWNKDRDKAGVLNGVRWEDADAVFMPLGPRHAIALSKTKASGYRELSEPEVVKLNKLQVQAAHKDLYSRPGSGIAELVAEALWQSRRQSPPA